MTSIKKNIFYSSILTVSGYLFPLLTFPYITRVLGVKNIGVCNFVDSIVQYFIYFSMMGMMTVGIREIARAKGDRKLLSKTFSELLSLNLLATLIAVIILLICTMCIPQMSEHKSMFFIGSAKILANTLLIEWLFKGIEDFKYITLRSVIIRGLYVIAVFIFVRKAEDYQTYFLLTSLMVVVNAAVNIVYSRKFVSFTLRGVNMTPYVKPFLILGSYLLLTSMYTTFNVAYLGFVGDTTEVGYYTTATKLYLIIMSFFTAFTGVMMPRMSSLIAEGKIQDFRRLIDKSINALLAFAFPLIIIGEICAPQIIRIIAGEGYEGAIFPMRIVMPLMAIIGYEEVIVLQVLSPMKKDTAILKNSFIGAIVGILLNILIVPRYLSVGTSIVWVMSECTVMLAAQYYVSKYIEYKMPVLSFIKRLLYSLPIVIVLFFINRRIESVWISLIVVSGISLIYCVFIELYILRNELIREYYLILINKIKQIL